jgi:hypothetical protein
MLWDTASCEFLFSSSLLNFLPLDSLNEKETSFWRAITLNTWPYVILIFNPWVSWAWGYKPQLDCQLHAWAAAGVNSC